MAKRRVTLCLWLVLLAEIGLTAVPVAARAEEAEKPPGTAMRGTADSGDVPLYLESRVNGRTAGLAEFTLRGTELWAAAATLQPSALSARSLPRLARET